MSDWQSEALLRPAPEQAPADESTPGSTPGSVSGSVSGSGPDFVVVTCQGRVADRTDGALPGAQAVGQALGQYLQQIPRLVGTPDPAAQDDWTLALPAARRTLQDLQEAVRETLAQGVVPILATNTCAASLGTVPAAAAVHPGLVVLWIDAHGDFNTPTSTNSGYLGGMALAGICGLWDSGHGAGVDPRDVILVGARDIDPAERDLLDRHGVRILAPHEADPQSIAGLVAGRQVWIHVDWDVLEPGYIPAAYKVPHGLRPHQISVIFAALSPGQVRGVEFAEFELGETDVPAHLSVELIVQIFQHLQR